MEGAAGFEGALITEFLETPFAVVGGDEGGDGYGLPDLVCKDFWATEAALSFGVLAHNLIVLFEHKLGWQEAVTLGTLRYWLFVTAGIISRPQGQMTIKLAVPTHERDWWRGLWDKLLSPNPNCNAVGTRPAFA